MKEVRFPETDLIKISLLRIKPEILNSKDCNQQGIHRKDKKIAQRTKNRQLHYFFATYFI